MEKFHLLVVTIMIKNFPLLSTEKFPLLVKTLMMKYLTKIPTFE
jgi:hypothetical protein